MHMHTYLLNPRSVASGSGRQYRPQVQSNKQCSNAQATLTVDVTQDGMTICKKFNRFRGCNFDKCSFAHVCNRKSPTGFACGLFHPGFQHNFKVPKS